MKTEKGFLFEEQCKLPELEKGIQIALIPRTSFSVDFPCRGLCTICYLEIAGLREFMSFAGSCGFVH